MTVYASWNGATRVARWRVLTGRHAQALHTLGHGKTKHGFETAIKVHNPARYVAVEALDAHGQVLARSRLVTVRT